MKVNNRGCVIIGCLGFSLLSPGLLSAQEGDTHETRPCVALTHIDYARRCGEVDNLHNLQRLQPGECALMRVSAKSRWNASGLLLEADGTYGFSVAEGTDNCWQDAGIITRGEGWRNGGMIRSSCAVAPDTQHKGCWLFGAFEGLRRYPDADWFSLIGVTSKSGCCSDGQEFVIGNAFKDFTPERDAEFCAYANDLSFMYWNNTGALTIRIERSQ